MKIFRALALAAPLLSSQPASAGSVVWSAWNEDLFARAKAENRLVILDLEAVWCHWCHVMESVTYADASVDSLIDRKFIAARADQDANPELSSRYGDWGWPATIIFAPDGTELAKMRGFIEPARLASLMNALIDDPTPGPSAVAQEDVAPAASAFLTPEQRAELKKDFDASYDRAHGGWGGMLRYIDADSFDYDMSLAESGDPDALAQARQTLAAATALIDPVWGGVYQYSDKADWSSPHFEKIISFQTQYLREYSQAYARWRDPLYLKTATAIKNYMTGFLLDTRGAFYVSQDADLNRPIDGHAYYALDDAARRKLGQPRIDRSIYANTNGAAISALSAYYDATGDASALQFAAGAAKWIQAHRALEGGGFSHSDKDKGGPFLADTLAMGQAFIDLYAATGGRDWLQDAAAAGAFIAAYFKDGSGGFVPSRSQPGAVGVFARPIRQLDDQIAVARFMNLLNRYTGQAQFHDLAEYAIRYAVAEAEETGRPLPGLLLADRELGHAPTHITIVGPKADPEAQKLAVAARAYPATYKRLDWWDKSEGKLANPDIDYPDMDQPAAFACGDRICSPPAFNAGQLKTAIERMTMLGKPKGAAQTQ